MTLLDRVPGEEKLYIGGVFTLRRKTALRKDEVTHILSVLRAPLEEDLIGSFTHMVIPVHDLRNENIIQHFPAANRFIQGGLDGGGGVLVHCAMGKSRSAACVMAYLMHKHQISPDEALARIRECRPMCEPNEGFMDQLNLYHRMKTPTDLEREPAYQRWMYEREIESSRAAGQAPELDKLKLDDEYGRDDGAGKPDYDLRCRKCRARRTLATSEYVTSHLGKAKNDIKNVSGLQPCAHIFLEPLSWMRLELDQGKLDGRLECPKCKTNVGKYAWQGMRCSCGEWVVPGISLARGRVDQVRSGSAADVAGIRNPPHMSETSRLSEPQSLDGRDS